MVVLAAFLLGLVVLVGGGGCEVAVILMVVNFEYEPLLKLLNLGATLLNLEMGFTSAISAAIFWSRVLAKLWLEF